MSDTSTPSGHLGAADDGDEGVPGLVEQTADHLDLPGEQPTRRRGQVLRWPDDRGVRPVRGPEGVVHVAVVAGDELVDEGRVVRLLARVEAQVLQQLHAGHELGEVLADGSDVVTGVRYALGPAEMGRAGDRGSVVEEPPQRRDRLAHPEVVGDDAPAVHLADRHVEIDAHEDRPAPDRGQVLEDGYAAGHLPTSSTSSTSRCE
jgi:hypothetical protein